MRVSVTVLVMAMLAACTTGSGTRPAAAVVPVDVNVRLGAPLFFGSSSVASAMFDVTITNQATVPMTIRRIRLSPLGGVQYAIQPLERTFAESLAPGESKSVRVTTSAVASEAGINPTERMNVRLEAEFEMPDGRRFRKVANVLNVAP